MTEDEIIGGHHRLSGHLFEQTKPGVLQSMGSQRVRHDRSDLAHTHAGTEG